MADVSSVGLRIGTIIDLEYCGSFRNGLVRMNTKTSDAWLDCLRSFSAARDANSDTASARGSKASTDRPNERVHAICFLGSGASSSPMQGIP